MKNSSLDNHNKPNIDNTTLSSNNHEFTVVDNSIDNKEINKKIRQRHENSLGELTKNFIKYIKDKGDNVVHINEVVKVLKVKKRRIYDITNVLEGIGYIKKIEKNKVKWLKGNLANNFKDNNNNVNNINDDNNLSLNLNEDNIEYNKELEDKKILLQNLKDEENKLDASINNLQLEFDSMIKDENFKKYAYITYKDLISLTNNGNNKIIAISAPIGTKLEMPDSKSIEEAYIKYKHNVEIGKEEYNSKLLENLEKKYQLFIEAPTNGEINIYIPVNKDNNNNNNINNIDNNSIDNINNIQNSNSNNKELSNKINNKDLNSCFNYSNLTDNTLNLLDSYSLEK